MRPAKGRALRSTRLKRFQVRGRWDTPGAKEPRAARNLIMTSSRPKRAPAYVDRRRRRHTRYRSEFRITVNHLLGNQYQKIEGHCRDLSEAGIGILLAAELNVSEVTGLSFSPPGSSNPWEVRAVVRYRRGYHYGFEFLSLTSEQQQWLKNYVTTLEPMD